MKLYFTILIFLLSVNVFAQDTTRKYSIRFKEYKSILNKEGKFTLNTLAAELRKFPAFNIEMKNACGATENQRMNEASWDRLNNIIDYLVKTLKIDPNRILVSNTEITDCNKIDLILTSENPLNIPDKPHPRIKKNMP